MICARGLRSGPEENEREEYLRCAQCGLTWVRDGRLAARGYRRPCEGVGAWRGAVVQVLHDFMKPAQNAQNEMSNKCGFMSYEDERSKISRWCVNKQTRSSVGCLVIKIVGVL